MLQQIRIQNFKSLKDVTLDLQQVNLLIGPNNSGKSNLMKALEFLGGWISNEQKLKLSKQEFERLTFNQESITTLEDKYNPITFSINFDTSRDAHLFQTEFISEKKVFNIIGKLKDRNIKNIRLRIDNPDIFFHQHKVFEQTRVNIDSKNDHDPFKQITFFPDLYNSIVNSFNNLVIYKPDPAKFIPPSPLSSDEQVNADASNLVPFLFNLGQNHKRKFRELEDDLKNCIGDIVSIGTPSVKTKDGEKLRLKFFDDEDHDFWADEVSEGVLYFLALLCIIHQPNPPKLLLLEEPEKGIHPRRIKEVMDFIFQLAQEKGIQIILTSHSVHVVDEFSSLPESVFVFDKNEDGSTVIKNLQKDIIEPANEKSMEADVPAIRYTEPLSEHWVNGFLGGVPQ